MLFYVLSVVIMLILRGLAKRLILTNRIYVEYLNKATFAALYFYPIMFIIHVVAAGVICMHISLIFYDLLIEFIDDFFFIDSTFPLITMFVFLISSNIHLSNVFKNEFEDHTNKLVSTTFLEHIENCFYWFFYLLLLECLRCQLFKSVQKDEKYNHSDDSFLLLFLLDRLVYSIQTAQWSLLLSSRANSVRVFPRLVQILEPEKSNLIGQYWIFIPLLCL